MHLLKLVATNSPFDTQASFSKCPPSAWINFLIRVTRELVILRSTAAFIQADGGHFEQLAWVLNGESITVHLKTYFNK